MNYPTAIVIAAALLSAAILWSDQPGTAQSGVPPAIAPIGDQIVVVAFSDKSVYRCYRTHESEKEEEEEEEEVCYSHSFIPDN